MLLDRLDGHRPAHHGMALFATCAHLSPVNVSVAVGALVADLREYKIRMALRTCDVLMHAAKRVARGVVIKLRHAADWLPSADRVAVLAGDRQRSVRAARVGRTPALLRWHAGCECER